MLFIYYEKKSVRVKKIHCSYILSFLHMCYNDVPNSFHL